MMQTSRTGIFKMEREIKAEGFTLIELIVVIFIISLTTALIMPSFWGSGENILKTEAKRISSTLRYTYDESIGKKQTYLLNVDLDKQMWGFRSKNEEKNFRIKEDLEIRDVMVPSLGEISTGEVTVEFGPLGPEESIIIHLKKGTYEYTIMLNHLNGRTKILEGYKL